MDLHPACDVLGVYRNVVVESAILALLELHELRHLELLGILSRSILWVDVEPSVAIDIGIGLL